MTPNASSIPQTLLRSAPQAQHLWKNAHDRAVKTYGDLSRAHRVAFTALKNEFQKDGDRWVPKAGKKLAAVKTQVAAKTKTVAAKVARAAKAVAAPAKTKEPRKASSATTRRRQRKTTPNNKTVTRKRSVQRSKK
jgi:cation transport regulator ChaB